MTEKEKERYFQILKELFPVDLGDGREPVTKGYFSVNNVLEAMHRSVLTTPSPMDKLVEWLEGEYEAAKIRKASTNKIYDMLVVDMYSDILAKAKELLHAERR